MTTKLKIFLLVVVSTVFIDCKKYNNYTLFRSLPRTNTHLNFLKNLQSNPSFNFWTYPGSFHMPVDFVASIQSEPKLINDAEKIGLPLTTVNENIQYAFDTQNNKSNLRSKGDSFNWNSYFRLSDIYKWLEDLAKQFPAQIKLLSIGNSQQSRNIMGVRIALNESSLRSKVIIEGGIHGREWISPAFVTCLIDKILHAGTSDNSNLKNIAYTYEWFFVPVLNPDGYEFSHTDDRLWSKNRNGYGVDLNRNFAYEWTIKASKDKMSQVYCGKRPFSEPESWALADFVRSKSEGLEYYIAIHSYGQHLVLPDANPKDKWNIYVKKKCRIAADRISARFNNQYTVGTGQEIYGYKVTGTSDSWAKKEFNIPFVVTFALRDQGKYGFALPPDQIMPTCLETIEGIISLLTPETKTFNASLRNIPTETISSGHVFSILDKIVVVFNVFLFIIVRFE